MVHAYVIANAINASARKNKKVASGVSIRCARSILVDTCHFSRLEKTTIPLATHEDYHVHITHGTYNYAYARQTQVNREKETNKIWNRKEAKEKRRRLKKTTRRKVEITVVILTNITLFVRCFDRCNFRISRGLLT